MTLWQYLCLWLDTYVQPKRSKKTVDAYRYALAHLGPEIRTTDLAGLTPLQLQREINSLAGVYSRQAQLMFIALRAALARAVRLGMISASPMDICDPPAHQKRDIDYLTQPEAAAYLAAAWEDPKGPLLILMLCLGLRRNEARAIRAGDLGADGVLRIRHQRTADGLAPLKSRASRRDIPVPEPLRAIFEGQVGEYLVDCSETALRRSHLAVLAKCGIDRRITLHGLRHTCASLAVQSGSQLVAVQRLLGHSRFGVTADVYVHLDQGMMKNTTLSLFSFVAAPYGVGARLEIV